MTDDIIVRRSMHVKGTLPNGVVQVANVAYATRDRNEILESIRNGTRGVIRRSTDNGATWKQVKEWPFEKSLESWLLQCWSLPTVFCDPETEMLLRTFFRIEF